jgi:hypothetical protein
MPTSLQRPLPENPRRTGAGNCLIHDIAADSPPGKRPKPARPSPERLAELPLRSHVHKCCQVAIMWLHFSSG